MILNRLCQPACRIMMEVYICKRSQLHLLPFGWSHGLPLGKSWLLVFLDNTWRICLCLLLLFTSEWWKIHGVGCIFIWCSSAYGMQMEEGSSCLLSTADAWCISWHPLTKWFRSTGLPLLATPLPLEKCLPTQGSRGRKEIWQFSSSSFICLLCSHLISGPEKRIIF